MAEHETTLKNIARYEDILNNYDSMAQVIIEDLERTKKEYGRKRRTVVENVEEAVFEEKKIEEMEVCFLMDRFGYAKIMDKNLYERNKETILEEYKYVFFCMNTDKICLFTDQGQMHTVKVLDLPMTKLRDKGTPVDNVSNYSSAQERILYVSSMENVKNSTLLFVTKSGMAKQVKGEEFDVVKKAAVGVRAMKLMEEDELENAYLLESRMEYSVEYKGKQMILNKIKLGKRDTKGTKVRV